MRALKYVVMTVLFIILGTVAFIASIFFLDYKKMIYVFAVFMGLLVYLFVIVIRRMVMQKRKLLCFQVIGSAVTLLIAAVFLMVSNTIIFLSSIVFIQLKEPVMEKAIEEDVTLHSVYSQWKEKSKYNKAFINEKYKNANLMYTSAAEGGIDLVKYYIDNIQKDCETVLSPVARRDVNIKLQYDEKIHKSYIPKNIDYKALYRTNIFTNEISTVILDAYEDILASSAYDFERLIRHEYTHYYLDMFFKDKNVSVRSIPMWFNEGVAEYFAYASPTSYIALPEKIIPFKEITREDQWVKAFNPEEDIYGQAYSSIFYLCATKGEGIIRDILMKTIEKGFEEGFKDSVGITIEAFEEEIIKLAQDKKKDDVNWKGYKLRLKTNIYENVEEKYQLRKEGIEKYISNYPNNVKAYIGLSMMYLQEEDYKKSLELSEKAVQLEPNNTLAINRRALVALICKDYKKAQQDFEKLIELEPNNSAAYINLSQVFLFTDVHKAVEIMGKAVKIENTQFNIEILNSYKNYEKALKQGNTLKACYDFLESNEDLSPEIKLALITKTLDENGNRNSKYKSDLEALKRMIEQEEI